MDVSPSNVHAFDRMHPKLPISREAAERFRQAFAYAQAHYFVP